MRRLMCLLCVLALLCPVPVLGEGDFVVVEEEETLAPDARRQARALMKGMTDEEKIYQLFFVTPEDLTGEGNPFARYPVGGVAIYGKDILSEGQLKELTDEMQARARSAGAYPLLIGVHEAGGAVSRVANKLGYEKAPGPEEVKDASAAREAGERIAAYLAPLGINMDFSVPLDTRVSGETDIALRAYEGPAEQIYLLAGAMGEALRKGGVIPCFGHFPNDGSLSAKKYDGTAYNRRALADMRSYEWLPFIQAVSGGAEVIMMSNGILRAAGDDMPASLSRQAVGLLREELGFDGVVMTESLRDLGVTNFYKPEQAAVLAIRAGADMLFLPADPQAAARGLLRAIETGEISRERLESSVERILALKINAGIIR